MGSIGTTLVFFSRFFSRFFSFYIISDVVRMRAQLFGMIVIGTLAIWLLDTTTGELVPTRRERINGIFDRRVKLMKDLPARGKREKCLGKDEVCLPHRGPCCSPYACKSGYPLPKCRSQN